jgi:4-amino-4-deoxy-L-arabinose transferase-like glycosyltransferase
MKLNKKLLLILFLSLALRIYKVAQVPPSLYWDEAAMALDARAISLTAKDQHGNSWFQAIYPSWGDYKLPAYILTAVPFFRLIKNNPELAVRLPSVLAGILTVLVIYFLTKELFLPSRTTPGLGNEKDNLGLGELMALIASFLLAISPWHIHFSRAAFEANLALFFNSLALFFFLKAREKKICWLATIIFSTLGIYTYYSARIVLPLILLSSFLFFWPKARKNIFTFFLSLGIIFCLSLPLRFSPLFKQAEQFRLSTKNILNDPEIILYSSRLIEEDNNSFWAKKIHHRFLYQAKTLASHYFSHFDLDFLILKGDSNLRHSTTRIGVLLLVAFIGLLYGEYWLLLKNKKLFCFLNLCLLICFLPACVPYEVPHALRSLNAVIFLNMIAAYGLIQLISRRAGSSSRRKAPLIVYCFSQKLIILWMILLIQFVFYLYDYYLHYSQRSFLAWQGVYREVVKRVDQEYKEAERIVFTTSYSRPYIYFLLYSSYPIESFQNQRQALLVQEPLNYGETFKIDKIEFRTIDKEKDSRLKGALVVVERKAPPFYEIWKNY